MKRRDGYDTIKIEIFQTRRRNRRACFNGDVMRLFIAVQTEKEMKKALLALQEEFRRRGVRGNYTKPENLHLTLVFIGEFSDLTRVQRAMESVCFEPVNLRISGIGSFGDVWWAGIEENEELDALVKKLRRALANAGIPFDRKRFLPHITLIRKPEWDRDPDLGKISVPRGETCAEEISLMLSTRGKSGVIYTELSAIPAKGGKDGT